MPDGIDYTNEIANGIDVFLLDSQYHIIDIFDAYISLNWAERFVGPGEVELVLRADSRYLAELNTDLYLSINLSEQFMIIEKIVLAESSEDGDTLTITGRTLESVLDRRVVYPEINASGKVKDIIRTLIASNAMSPSNTKRKIDNMSFETEGDATGDSSLLDQTIDEETPFNGELLSHITDLATQYDLGYRAVPKAEGGFTFILYTGTDRSGTHPDIPRVVFSHDYENLISTQYVRNASTGKTVCYIKGGFDYTDTRSISDGSDYVIVVTNIKHVDVSQEVYEKETSGLNRREMVVDASTEAPTEVTSETAIVESNKYRNAVRQEGLTELYGANKSTEAMDGEMDAFGQFKYGLDFFLGDIVSVENSYGISARCRISEFVISVDASGVTYVPTFEFITEED